SSCRLRRADHSSLFRRWRRGTRGLRRLVLCREGRCSVSPSGLVEMDITVAGAGPAGSACATLMRHENPRLSICLLERTQFLEPRPGEVLPAEALPLLRRLGYPVRTLLEMSI